MSESFDKFVYAGQLINNTYCVWIAQTMFIINIYVCRINIRSYKGRLLNPAIDLYGLSRYVQAPNGAHRYRLRPCVSLRQGHVGVGATDDLSRSFTDRQCCRPIGSLSLLDHHGQLVGKF